MRRNKVLATLLTLIVVAASVTLAAIYVHDNPAGITPISSINTGNTPIGSNVTLKGRIIDFLATPLILSGQNVLMSDGSGNISFISTETQLQINWTIIVGGTILARNLLYLVSDVELVLLFP
jgi:hypothetical protein